MHTRIAATEPQTRRCENKSPQQRAAPRLAQPFQPIGKVRDRRDHCEPVEEGMKLLRVHLRRESREKDDGEDRNPTALPRFIDIVTASPPVSPSLVQRIMMIQNETAAT